MKKTVSIICAVLFIACASVYLYGKYKEHLKAAAEKKWSYYEEVSAAEKSIHEHKIWVIRNETQMSILGDHTVNVDSVLRADGIIKMYVDNIRRTIEDYEREYGKDFDVDNLPMKRDEESYYH